MSEIDGRTRARLSDPAWRSVVQAAIPRTLPTAPAKTKRHGAVMTQLRTDPARFRAPIARPVSANADGELLIVAARPTNIVPIDRDGRWPERRCHDRHAHDKPSSLPPVAASANAVSMREVGGSRNKAFI
jgi:hypothetical protein